MELDELIDQAQLARQHAYAPYSRFCVGAALEDVDGRAWTGCNVECASYSLTLCAERVALVRAVAQGVRRFRRLVVLSPGGAWPCGACRQLLAEFAPQLEVVVADCHNPGQLVRATLSQLLPHSFQLNRGQ